MATLIVYDSNYGNTRQIALHLAEILPGAKVIHVSDFAARLLADTDLLLLGSPTIGGRPTEAIQRCVVELPNSSLKGIAFATFDTRLDGRDHGAVLQVILKLLGYAAEKNGCQLTC